MAHPKKRHLHYCIRHPKVIAIGRCSACKSWMCRECAATSTSNRYCSKECGKESQKTQPDATADSSSVQQIQPTSFSKLMIWAIVTLGLCGAVFGLWEVREKRAVQAEVETLKEKRLELIDHIKDANREIASLRSELDSLLLSRPAEASANKKKALPSARQDNQFVKPLEGLPISFDNGNATSRIVALTFDGSSNNNAADEILDTLKSRNVKTTMFLSGAFLRAFPEIVKRIAEEGHEVGNHTYSHPHLTSWAQDHTQTTLPGVTEAFLCEELNRTDSVFCALTGGHFRPIWRAPYGEKNRVLCVWAQRCGFLHIGWRQGKSWRLGLDSNDWVPDEETPGFHTPEEVLDKILNLAQAEPDGINGGIILMHLGTVRKDSKAQVHHYLGTLIDRLRQGGYEFVTVSQMLKESGVDSGLLGGKNLTRN